MDSRVSEKGTSFSGESRTNRTFRTYPSTTTMEYEEDLKAPEGSLVTRFIDSFRRDPYARATPKDAIGSNGKVYDVETAAINTAESPLARKLKGRHLQMIAIGGSIGGFPLV